MKKQKLLNYGVYPKRWQKGVFIVKLNGDYRKEWKTKKGTYDKEQRKGIHT
jgi:hypothetical protein